MYDGVDLTLHALLPRLPPDLQFKPFCFFPPPYSSISRQFSVLFLPFPYQFEITSF